MPGRQPDTRQAVQGWLLLGRDGGTQLPALAAGMLPAGAGGGWRGLRAWLAASPHPGLVSVTDGARVGVAAPPSSHGESEEGSAALQVLRFCCCCCFCKGEKSMKTELKMQPSSLVGLVGVGCARPPALGWWCSTGWPWFGLSRMLTQLWGTCLPVPPGCGTTRTCCVVPGWGWPGWGRLQEVWQFIQVLSSCPVVVKEADVQSGHGKADAMDGNGQEMYLAGGKMWKSPSLPVCRELCMEKQLPAAPAALQPWC